VELS
jgi:hypothetical protein